MTTRLRYAWIPIVTASALALTACGGEDDTGGQNATDVPGHLTARRPARSAERAGHTRSRTRVSAATSTPRATPLSTFALDVDNGSYRIAQAYARPGHPPDRGVGARGGVGQRLRVRRPGADRGRPRRPHRVGRPARGRRGASWSGWPSPRARSRPRTAVGQPDPGRGPLGQHGRGQPHGPGEGLAGVAGPGRCDPTTRSRSSASTTRSSWLLAAEPVSEIERDASPRSTTCYAARQHEPGRRVCSLGYEQARSAYRPGGINVVVLCSDGVANVGATGPESITASASARRRSAASSSTTVGFGMGNYNDALMEQLADQGDGTYHYVDALAEAARSSSRTSRHARAVAEGGQGAGRVQPRASSRWRLLGYENRDVADRDFPNDPSTPASSAPGTRRGRSTSVDGPRRGPGHAHRHRPGALEDARHERARHPPAPRCSRPTRGPDVGLPGAGHGRRRPRPDRPGLRRWTANLRPARTTSQARAAELATRGVAGRGPSLAELGARSSPRLVLTKRQDFVNHREQPQHGRDRHAAVEGPEALPLADRPGRAVAGLPRLRRVDADRLRGLVLDRARS